MLKDKLSPFLISFHIMLWKLRYFLIYSFSFSKNSGLCKQESRKESIVYENHYFSGKENDVAILNRYGVFKRYILKVSDWYFKTDSDSQFKNFSIYHNDFSNIEICFSLLQWDADCLNRLEDSLNTLKRSLPARDNLYSQTNGRAAMNSFKRIIYNSQAKIEEVINGGWSYYESIHEIIESAESI